MAYHKPNQILGSAFGGSTITSTHPDRNLHLLLCDFLDVFIQQVLYERNLYDAHMFQRCQKFSTPVRICRHPSLSQYIENVVRGIQYQLHTDKPMVVVINIVQPSDTHKSYHAPHDSADMDDSDMNVNADGTSAGNMSIIEQYRIEIAYSATPSSIQTKQQKSSNSNSAYQTAGQPHHQGRSVEEESSSSINPSNASTIDDPASLELDVDEYRHVTSSLGTCLMRIRELDQQVYDIPLSCTFNIATFLNRLSVRPQPTFQYNTSMLPQQQSKSIHYRHANENQQSSLHSNLLNTGVTDLKKVFVLMDASARESMNMHDSIIYPIHRINLPYLYMDITLRQRQPQYAASS